jgi:hypothetical protein
MYAMYVKTPTGLFSSRGGGFGDVYRYSFSTKHEENLTSE